MNALSKHRRAAKSSMYALAACVLLGCASESHAPELRAESASLDLGGDATRRVVVVGAGLAGLTAARDLREQGWEVVLLEARERVGGRVHTLHSPLSGDMHAELGGESIDDTHTAIQDLAADYGLPLERRTADKTATGVIEYRHQRTVIGDFLQRQGGLVALDYGLVDEALGLLALGLDIEHPEAFPLAAQLDRESFAEFLADLQLVPPASFAATVVNRAGYASELEDVSLLFAVLNAAAADDETDDEVETLRITGGNQLLPQALADDLGQAVHLRTPVTRIDEADDHVRVHAGKQVIDAAYAVLAVPPPPLRRIHFSPPLPDTLGRAVHELELGPALKVISEYATRFWELQGESGVVLSEQDYGVAWSSSDSYPSEHGLLTQFVTGHVARRWSRLSDGARIELALRELATVYPQAKAQRVGSGFTLSWVNERYSGGGYAVYAPTQVTRFFPAFRQGTKRLRFAGEHTEALTGYMESAVRSGHRIAQELGAPL